MTEDLLIVALCDGPRCHGLRTRAGSDPAEHIRSAVAGRERAVLVHSGCLGRCEQGSVAVVGSGRYDDGRLDFVATPWMLCLLDRPGAGRAAAKWIAGAAPSAVQFSA